jgi:hypothetical protein
VAVLGRLIQINRPEIHSFARRGATPADIAAAFHSGGIRVDLISLNRRTRRSAYLEFA